MPSDPVRPGTGASVSETHFDWTVEPDTAGSPLAVYLSDRLLVSEEQAGDLIDFGCVHLDGRRANDPRRIPAEGESVRVYMPWGGTRRTYEIDPARILYRDAAVIVYDKESGTPSQQTPSDGYNNLFEALRRYIAKENGPSNHVGMHHRLDRDTSGVMIFSLDRAVDKALGDAFRDRMVHKTYLAWTDGVPPLDEWTCDRDIGRSAGRYRTFPKGKGRSAETLFRVLHRTATRALVLARPLTGRTHQLRLHLADAGLPVVGDRLYGRSAGKLLLHAFRLDLPHPATKETLSLTASVPDHWPEPRNLDPDVG